MCGINGIAYSPAGGRRVDESVLCAMRDVISHRGPDAKGAYVNENIGLGHRRLSIVDVELGAQPMASTDGAIQLVFNGEIYNHRELRPGLESKGHKYRTTSDTETILYLYEEFGYSCVEKLRGMFAFAIWDDRKKQLFLARDRIGIKPLYYVLDSQGSLYFGSEIKALVAAGAVRPELNFDVLPDQLANHGTSHEQTLYREVKRLLPGHFLVWKDGNAEIKKYWDISYEPKAERPDDKDFVAEWLEEFKRSVEMRLMADVPLGMFLSGGIDSSAICALMSKMVDEPIKTFSVGFKEREANEFEYARTVSRAFETEHHEISLSAREFFHELPKLIWHEDEPLGFTASVPLYFVSKLAAKHVKVVLTGEGSDELMAGYGRYGKAVQLLEYGAKYEELLPGSLRKVVKSGVRALPGQLGGKLNRTFLSRNADIEGLLFDNFAIFSKSLQEEILTADTKAMISEKDPYRYLKMWFGNNDAKELLDKILYADSKTYLQELLMKQDQMSMAASIESRVPFLDHKLVELTSRMPVSMKLRGRTTKWILREAMKGILPAVILERPKMGFPVPIDKWLRGEFRHIVDEFVLGERALSRGMFDKIAIRNLADRHMNGENAADKLFLLINLEIWQRQVIENETVEIF